MAALSLTTAGDICGDTWDCRSSFSDFGSSQHVHLISCIQSCRDPPGEESHSAVLRTTFRLPMSKEESLPNKDRFLSLIVLLTWPIWDLTSDSWKFFFQFPKCPYSETSSASLLLGFTPRQTTNPFPASNLPSRTRPGSSLRSFDAHSSPVRSETIHHECRYEKPTQYFSPDSGTSRGKSLLHPSQVLSLGLS